jgi:hypothetical protein
MNFAPFGSDYLPQGGRSPNYPATSSRLIEAWAKVRRWARVYNQGRKYPIHAQKRDWGRFCPQETAFYASFALEHFS